MKKSLFLLLVCCMFMSFRLSAQHFSVSPSFYDSLTPTSYDFHLGGTAVFNDSMVVFFSVKSNDSIPQLLYIDSVDFTNPSLVLPSHVTYDAVSHAFSIGLGNYPTRYVILELYSIVGGETREHLLMNIHRLETPPEDEE